jgi:hypothetical protein
VVKLTGCYTEIQAFLAARLEKFPKAVKAVKVVPKSTHTEWERVPNVFDGRSAGRENNRDEVRCSDAQVANRNDRFWQNGP